MWFITEAETWQRAVNSIVGEVNLFVTSPPILSLDATYDTCNHIVCRTAHTR